MEYSPVKMQNNLQKNKFQFKKMFGQNFIVDENIINNIIRKSDIKDSSLVIEVGPGAGSLTYKLSKIATNVIAYEIDITLKEILEKNLNECSNVKIIYGDFLKQNIKKELENYKYKYLYLIANLPYYITTPIIIKIIEEKLDVEKIVVMVQKEVGNRFKAEPNSRDYNSLSIFLNYYFDINKIMDISKNIFMPKPNVDSTVIEFKKKNKRFNLINEELFFKLVKDAFKQKRKNLKNNLKEYNLIKIEEILKTYNFDLTARAEQLSIDVFVAIANNL